MYIPPLGFGIWKKHISYNIIQRYSIYHFGFLVIVNVMLLAKAECIKYKLYRYKVIISRVKLEWIDDQPLAMYVD